MAEGYSTAPVVVEDADAAAKKIEVREAIRKRCIAELPEILGEASCTALPDWLTDRTVDRFTRANNGDLDLTVGQLSKCWTWRVETKPRWLCCHLCIRDPTAHSLRVIGFDPSGRAIIYTCFQTSRNRYEAKSNVLHLQRILEDAQTVVDRNPTGPGKWVMFVDFHGFGMADASAESAQLAIALLQNYPERLGLAVLFDTGTLFEGVWKIVTPLLNEVTTGKISFTSSLEEGESLNPNLPSLGPEALDWLRREVAENRTDFSEKKRCWEDQGGFPDDRPEGLPPHDPRGCKSFVESDCYNDFLRYGEPPGDNCVPVVDFTVDKLFNGKIGVRLKNLTVSGLDIPEAGQFWNVGDEVLEVNGHPINVAADFGKEVKEAVKALPFTVKVFRHGSGRN